MRRVGAAAGGGRDGVAPPLFSTMRNRYPARCCECRALVPANQGAVACAADAVCGYVVFCIEHAPAAWLEEQLPRAVDAARLPSIHDGESHRGVRWWNRPG